MKQKNLADIFLRQAKNIRIVLMPGYTHMQVAMPSSFGLWFGAYAEALADDLNFLQGIYAVVNQNPLGSAAGFGSSFPVDRELTTRLLAFPGHAHQFGECTDESWENRMVCGNRNRAVASTMARMAMDAVLFMGQNFRFISLPAELTTGSSIMPHKKNPDVLELLRAQMQPFDPVASEISSVTGNLISGYHRDFQVLKEIIHPAIEELKNCMDMMQYVMEHMEVNDSILEDEIYHISVFSGGGK